MSHKIDLLKLKSRNLLQTDFIHSALCILLVLLSAMSIAQPHHLDSSSHHLRNSNQPEWEEFANKVSKQELNISFYLKNKTEHTISLVQYDVKQTWNVLLNERKIGSLVTDGNKMRVYFKVVPDIVKTGENKLTIRTDSDIADDIVITEITVDELPLEKVLTQATVDIEIVDRKTNKAVPSRITIVDRQKILQSTGTKPGDNLAIRPGFVYTGNGKISLQVPPGEYIIYGGRGFEYSVDSAIINIREGQHLVQKLVIQREVDTHGWISSDTHIHTLTNSGHGDATDVERALTIAGEGVELPVITEHNKITNFFIPARRAGVDNFFTIANGDELTTPVGHFNIFPLSSSETPPEHRVTTWNDVSNNLPDTGKTVVILNHGRDIHNGFRPFDPKHHVSISGSRLDTWKIPANAMEIINSGALQENPMSLVHDWFGLLNHGFSLTPIGASDSHDVSRYLLGQARTYVKSDDSLVADIDVTKASRNLREGRVMVSFGLLPQILVNKKYGPGDHALLSKNPVVEVEVAGPGWINGEQVSLYANGIQIRNEKMMKGRSAGVKWKGKWKLSNQKQDAFLVVIAKGSGEHLPYWPIVKPYQPVSISWTPYTMGVSGAVWIDADGDGKISTAHEYASKLVGLYRQDMARLFRAMSRYDEAVAIQVAALLHESGIDLSAADVTTPLSKASRSVREGFEKFVLGLRLSIGE